MKLLSVIGLLFFAIPAFASSEIRLSDPNGILGRVDRFVGFVPFEKAYRCGSFIKALRAGKSVKAVVQNCKSDRVTVVTTPGKKNRKDTQVVTRREYEADKGNLLRALLRSMTASTNVNGRPTDHYIELDNAEEYKLGLENGRSIEAMAVDVDLMMRDPFFGYYTKALTFRVSIARDVPALAQLAKVASPQGRPQLQFLVTAVGVQERSERRGD